MIERVRLTRWRIFDDVEITFGAGTTFVVAPNAAGKTSLLLGMAWAVYGDHSAVNAAECVRAGSTTAEAEVVLSLPGVGRLSIHRTVPIKGHATVAYLLDGGSLAPDEAESTLEAAFGVRLPIASQLSMMLGGGHLATEKDLDLKGHLYEAFGVAGLQTSAERAADVAKAATKQRESLRAASRDRLEDREDKMPRTRPLRGRATRPRDAASRTHGRTRRDDASARTHPCLVAARPGGSGTRSRRRRGDEPRTEHRSRPHRPPRTA